MLSPALSVTSQGSHIKTNKQAGSNEGQKKKGTTEDERVGWHHRFNGHGFEQTAGESEGQGSLECRSPWDCKELAMT